MNQEIKKHKLVRLGVIIFLIIVCFLMIWKAQLEPKSQQSVQATLISSYRENGTIQMNGQQTIISEMFQCTVPNLKSLRVQMKASHIDENAQLNMKLVDVDTGEAVYQKGKAVKSMLSSKRKKTIKLKFKPTLKDSEGKRYILVFELKEADSTEIDITSNYKPGIVESLNGNAEDKTNVIYTMSYDNCGYLGKLYILFAGLICVLAGMAYYMIVICKMPVQQFYIPLAIAFGIVVNVIIMVHGVPDEPSHLDTAYKYSNKLMFVKDTDEEGMLYKRRCDVIMEDMLGTDVESNSYYQLLHHTFELPKDKELVKVAYTRSDNLAPAIYFLPTAIGISIGRLLGLSSIVTLSLGRLMNMLVFILMAGWAIRIAPYGKNVIGALSFLPIALQQSASASYDAMINGVLFLYIAICLKFSVTNERKLWEKIMVAIAAILIVAVKGGVYIPALLLVLIWEDTPKQKKTLEKRKRGILIAATVVAILVVILACYTYLPTLIELLSVSERVGTGQKTMYSVGYIIQHPLQLVYMFWNTLMVVSERYLMGLLGGRLAWQSVKINWILLIVLLICVLLLANRESDRFYGSHKNKIIMAVISLMSIFLVMLSMVLAYTTLGSATIMGVQGRYYLCIAPLFVLPTANSMVMVNKDQSQKIWMTIISVDILVLLQFVVQVM